MCFGNAPSAGGWTSYDSYPRVLADMNGDGMADIVGYKGHGVWVSLSAGDRFLPPSLWVSQYTNQVGA